VRTVHIGGPYCPDPVNLLITRLVFQEFVDKWMWLLMHEIIPEIQLLVKSKHTENVARISLTRAFISKGSNKQGASAAVLEPVDRYALL